MMNRIWSFCCSLKLAIVLSSVVTLIAIAGSLVMHFNPGVFGDLDATAFTDWHRRFGSRQPLMTFWLYATGVLLALLAVNTLCCFIDWLFKFKARWRKTGEYLIHLGFVLIIVAYLWGSFAGSRNEGNTVALGQALPLAELPGHFLRVESFEPVLAKKGYPFDMKTKVALLQGDRVVAEQILEANTPLIVGDLTILQKRFGNETLGYDVIVTSTASPARIAAGSRIDLTGGHVLEIDRFYNDAVRTGSGVFARNSQAINPAILARLQRDGATVWSGWLFLKERRPQALTDAGFSIAVRGPVNRPYTLLTINRDPGLNLAFAGSILMTAGVLFALASFYYKRKRGDRPDIV